MCEGNKKISQILQKVKQSWNMSNIPEQMLNSYKQLKNEINS